MLLFRFPPGARQAREIRRKGGGGGSWVDAMVAAVEEFGGGVKCLSSLLPLLPRLPVVDSTVLKARKRERERGGGRWTTDTVVVSSFLFHPPRTRETMWLPSSYFHLSDLSSRILFLLPFISPAFLKSYRSSSSAPEFLLATSSAQKKRRHRCAQKKAKACLLPPLGVCILRS